jgi:hypothetical protein
VCTNCKRQASKTQAVRFSSSCGESREIRRDRIRNPCIRGELKMEENTEPNRSKLRWFRHVKRMDEQIYTNKTIKNKDELNKTQGQTMHKMGRPT